MQVPTRPRQIHRIDLKVWSKHPAFDLLIHISDVLAQKGRKAYLAGGCVRDALLGKVSIDLDLATNATPDEIETWFAKTVAVGKSFGVIRVLSENAGTGADTSSGASSGASSGTSVATIAEIEVASFRSDGDYLDGRHPERIIFASDSEDAKRRDFTINALFFDVQNETLIDHVGGLMDLQAGVLKTVGLAADRFKEDHLRILRLFRFQSQLGFEIEMETYRCAKVLANKLHSISRERIEIEIKKTFAADFFPKVLDSLFDFILPNLWPQFQNLDLEPAKRAMASRWSHFKNQNLLHNDCALFFLLAADFSLNPEKSFFDQFVQSLKQPKSTIRFLHSISKYLNREFWNRSDAEVLVDLLESKALEILQILAWDLVHLKFVSKEKLEFFFRALEDAPVPLVSGQDLLGIFSGADIGKALKISMLAQLEDKVKSKQEAIELLKEKFSK